MAPDTHLSVKGLDKSFGSVDALSGVDFEVRRGEVMSLVGDNGAGKSTLVKILCGAEYCDAGEFFLDGSQVSIQSPYAAAKLGIQIVYQDLALCENLDVAANLFLGHEIVVENPFTRLLPHGLRPLDELKMEKRTTNTISKLEVRTLNSVRSKIAGLSGGQRQAVAIARAIDFESSVVLLDEPTAALGVAQTRQVLDLVKRLRDTDHAVVFISHNLQNVLEVSDRITVLYHGVVAGVYEASEASSATIVAAITSGSEPG